jgi:tetratricopeptide (TPR) repeat protein
MKSPIPSVIERYRRELTICIVLAIATVGIHGRACENGFVNYDDETYVAKDPDVLAGLSVDGLAWAFTSTLRAANWHPLTWLSLQLDAEVYRLPLSHGKVLSGSGPAPSGRFAHDVTPFGFHLMNVLLHAVNTLLLFGILRAMTGAIWRSAVVAGLFALHPLHVESVAWIAERKDVLSGFFWMLCLWSYWDYVRHPGWRRYGLLLLCFAIGLLAKPMLVTLPAVLLLLDYWPLGRLAPQTALAQPREKPKMTPGMVRASTKQCILEKVPLLAMVVASSIVTVRAQDAGKALLSLEKFPLEVRISNALITYIAYLGKMVWPVELIAYYPHPEQNVSITVAALAAGTLLLVTGLVWGARSRSAYLLTGWFWYLGTLVPVVGIVQVGLQAMADRYTYIPLIGIFIMAAWGAAAVARALSVPVEVPRLAAAAVVGACAVLTWRQIGYWHDSVILWRHVLSINDRSDLAHYNYGQALAMAGEHDFIRLQSQGKPGEAESVRRLKLGEAAHEFAEARKINKNNKEALFNLGVILDKTGDPLGGMQAFRSVLAMDHDSAEAHYSLGLSLMRQGLLDEAAQHFAEASHLRPTDPTMRNNFGTALAQQGKLNEAGDQFAAVLQIDPDNATAHHNLGLILVQKGQLEEAIRHYDEAIQLRGESPMVLSNLGLALSWLGKKQEAFARYQKAVILQPKAGKHYYELAHVLGELGQTQAARSYYAQGKALDPGWLDSTNRFAWFLATGPDPRRRWGRMAIHLATEVNEATEYRQPEYLATLAAAYAESGRFDDALSTIRKGLDLLPPGASGGRQAMEAQMQLYLTRKPYRDGPREQPR